MPAHDFTKGSFQCCHGEQPFHAHACAHVVGSAILLKLANKPQALLSKRKRKGVRGSAYWRNMRPSGCFPFLLAQQKDEQVTLFWWKTFDLFSQLVHVRFPSRRASPLPQKGFARKVPLARRFLTQRRKDAKRCRVSKV